MVREGYKKNNIMTVPEFTKAFGYSRDLVYVHKRHGNKFVFTENKKVYVDVATLQKRKEFQERVWRESTDNYFKITEYIKAIHLAFLLGEYYDMSPSTWETYVYNKLFCRAFLETTLLHYKVPLKLYKFWRFSHWLWRELERKGDKRVQKYLKENKQKRRELRKYGNKKTRSSIC